MPSTSKAQQKFMGLVHAYKKGEVKGSEVSQAIKKAAKSMKKSSTKKYASTKHKGLPNKVKQEGFGGDLKGEDKKKFERARKANGEQLGYKLSGTSDVKEDRDYKEEYKKYGSSTKAKKYRAELNQYNRKKGTYGNGDGKDASHKGGKIVGFEKESTNRGRAEKSRLKKEASAAYGKSIEKIANDRKLKSISKKDRAMLLKIAKLMKKANESVNERKLSSHQKKAILIAIEMSGNMTGATKKIEKIKKGLSNDKKVKDALQLANESVNEGGMGVLSTDQADILQGIVLRNKTKNTKALLNVALKSGYFKNVDKKELLGYIDGARQFVKYMKSHPMESIDESGILYRAGVKKYGKEGMKKIQQAAGKRKSHAEIGKIKDKYEKESVGESVDESDLGLTYKKGKTVKVKHKKSGKELVIVDKPNVKREYEKIGFFAEGKLTNEAKTQSIGGEELMKFLMKRFKMSTSKAIATMKKHKMDLSFLKNESGILYRAGVKKYGKEGMRKIQQAAGKRKSHAEIGKIKDKYEKESLELDEGFGSSELMGQKDLAEFEKTRQKNAEVLGYKLTGKSDIKPIKEKSKVTK